jgi:hypothetical protein
MSWWLVMKEAKIFKMDWKALGYDPVYKDGRLTWQKLDANSQQTKEK